MKRWIIGLIVLLIAGGALYPWLTLKRTNSIGERVGYVRKLSNWEGQLSLVSIPGTRWRHSISRFETPRSPSKSTGI